VGAFSAAAPGIAPAAFSAVFSAAFLRSIRLIRSDSFAMHVLTVSPIYLLS
jgi:hypothetical protein